ncbi:HDOD domain-containing protein [Denitrobaculum tricleocarpae]|uniref:HDOD domain-containing protein n=1 Tax=Denitrobaculum tricleocarpae TaxID=2591009 RepID=A0A545TMS9_9PROT|nr:HDOD domain-containing protein [Denitrobaculum tricleocarpae]TQV78478.1 HDOD domain-containing protein [Denitrobaculum tricleocarpae]
MSARVIFVDDEPNILRGLQRTFRRLRNEWDMDFLDGGEAALSHLSENPVDVIVSDMRMPGVDGAQLMTEAARTHPESLRIILSGEADREMTFRTVGVSHQFLPKPCNTDSLCEKIQRSLAAKSKLPRADLQLAVSGTACLPVSEEALQSLKVAVEGDSSSLEDAADIFASEPGLAAKILQLANSAYFGIGQSVNSPAEAVRLLGIDIIRPLVDKGCFQPMSATPALNSAVFGNTLAQAKTMATLAQKAASEAQASPAEIELARVAGLLHNIGRLVICTNFPNCYTGLESGGAVDPAALSQQEDQAFNCTQDDVGGYLALLWGLPDPVSSAIAYQTTPGTAPDPRDTVLLALQAARQAGGDGRKEAAA